MGINFGIDLRSGKRQARRGREADVPALFEKLLDRGLTPDEAQKTANAWAATGELKPPTMRDGAHPPLAPQPISYAKPGKRKTLITMDEATGREKRRDFDLGPNDDLDFRTYDSRPSSIAETPQEKADRDVLAEYQRAVGNMVKTKGANGEETYGPAGVSEELAANARNAARRLGIPVNENQRTTGSFKKPGFGAGVKNAVSMATRGMVSPSDDQGAIESETSMGAPTIPGNQNEGSGDEEAFQRDMARAKEAVAKKVITPAEAARRLRLKYPDRFQDQ